MISPVNAPQINNRGFNISLDINPDQNQGTLIAQGGARHGYSLHISGSKLIFSVRTDRKLTEINIPAPPVGKITRVEATLHPEGKLSLKADGKETSGSAHLIPDQPNDPLSIGSDQQSPVGNYKSPNTFKGTITNAKVLIIPKS